MVLLVLAAIPTFGLVVYTDLDRRDQETEDIHREALRAARVVAAQNEGEIQGTRQLLLPVVRLFSRIPVGGIAELDRAACDGFLADLLRQSPDYANFGVATPDGEVVCSALPVAAPVNIADRRYFIDAVTSGEFSVGDYQIGRISGIAGINFGYPVMGPNGEAAAVVFAALGLEELSKLAAEAELPDGSAIAVVGLDGTILARYPDPERWIGVSAEGQAFLPAEDQRSSEGTVTAPGLDGRSRLYAHTPLTDPTGRPVATVVVGIPTSVAYAKANDALVRDLLVLGVIVVLVSCGAWWGVGRFILRPARSLMGAAKAMAAGDLGARTGAPYGRDEVGMLSRTFDEMAGALQVRAIELAELNRELERRVADRTAELSAALSTAERAETEANELWASSADLQCTTSQEGYFLRVNPAFGRVLGYSEGELLSRPIIDFVHPDDREAAVGRMARTRQGRPPPNSRARWLHKDGGYRWLDWIATPLPSGVIRGSGRDITEEKQAEQQLLQLTAELRARSEQLANANEELESFAYSVSHDLRAPLRAIIGFSEQLLSAYGKQLDERGRDRLSRVHAGAQRMSGLINDILQLSRTARAELRSQPLDLSAAAQAVVDELRQGDPERLVDVAIEPGLRAEGDSGLTRALLQNLLGNAWKFTSQSDAARIEFGCTQDDGTTVFHIRDNGVGFEAEYADKLFAPFQRLHSPHEFEGSGIGLATVQRIVRRHGGQIWAEGTVGEGATFYFTLDAQGTIERGLAA